MSSLIKRGAVWYITWYVDGNQRWKSTRIKVSDDPGGKSAKQVQRDHDSRAAKQIAGLEDERLTIQDALARQIASIRQASVRYQGDCKARASRLVKWFERRGIVLLEQILPKHIDKLIEERKRAGLAGKTIKYDLDQLKAAIKIANRTRTIKPIAVGAWPTVARTTAMRPERVGAYSLDEVTRIIEYLGKRQQRKHWQIPIKLLAYIGCRWGELEALRVGDVDLRGQSPMVRIESHKTARSRKEQHRYVEVHPAILQDLAALVSGRGTEDLLINVPDRHNACNVLTRACKALKIRYRRLHGLRHCWISTMLSAGVPLAVVMTMAGHRNLSTTQGYLHLDPKQTGWISRLTTANESANDSTKNKPV